MRKPEKKILRFRKRQKGITLLETAVSLALLGIIGVGFLTGITNIYNGRRNYERQFTGLSLAQSQLEEIKASAYLADGSYPVAVALPQGYNLTISAAFLEPTKQEITVAVSQDGHGIVQLKAIKTNR